VGREFSDQLEAAAQSTSEIFVTYRPFNSNDIEKPQIRNPITLTLSDVEADVQRVVGRASMLNIGNKSWPALVYTARQFPGLAR
jgi:hypothetical protein